MTAFRTLALLALAGLASWASADDVRIAIGHAGPLTGPAADAGKDNENGVRMALDDFPAHDAAASGRGD